MILSLLASAGARYWAGEKRDEVIPRRGADASTSSLSGMNSFALGLLLGGLRGPLVMILWTESETQKSDKNLEGVDTQIEWIRLLQPEFDTVHIFEIWNKAYNISVQMANRANKYDVILGALDYAHNVDKAKPDDINIIAAIGQLYFDKYGNASPEKYYYRKRVRQETLPHTNLSKFRSKDPGWRRVTLDPMLNASFDILPELYKPKPGRARPANFPANLEWNDGSELQYLPKYEPYPDGISPFGLAYNYYKRAEVLQNVEKQQHAQLSDLVIDSRPALALKFWAEEELEQGHRRELQAFGVPLKEGLEEDDLATALQSLTAGFTVDHPVKDMAALKLAISDIARATVLIPDSLAEYRRHILNFPQRDQQYQSYMDELSSEEQIGTGDLLYLKAFIAPPAERDALLKQAAEHYKESQHLNFQILLKYYLDTRLVPKVLPPGYSVNRLPGQKSIDDLSYDQAMKAVVTVDHLKAMSRDRYVNTDRYEFDRFIRRAGARMQAIDAVLNKK
jgi:hypothetical protein